MQSCLHNLLNTDAKTGKKDLPIANDFQMLHSKLSAGHDDYSTRSMLLPRTDVISTTQVHYIQLDGKVRVDRQRVTDSSVASEMIFVFEGSWFDSSFRQCNFFTSFLKTIFLFD